LKENCGIAIHEVGLAVDGESQRLEQPLDQIHDVFVIGIGPIAFEHREFRIVPGRHAFVAEVAVDFEHLVGESGHQRTLEIEFRRNAQEHVELECVVVRLEGLGRGAAIDGMQHRRLDFHEAVIFHEAANAGDDLRALLETHL
jgi:hypothetical protein